MAISQELLDILACPKCKGDIYQNDSKDGLICDNCKLLYEIRDDIPIMLIDEAKPLEELSRFGVHSKINSYFIHRCILPGCIAKVRTSPRRNPEFSTLPDGRLNA